VWMGGVSTATFVTQVISRYGGQILLHHQYQ